jgi:hypothetical protein
MQIKHMQTYREMHIEEMQTFRELQKELMKTYIALQTGHADRKALQTKQMQTNRECR